MENLYRYRRHSSSLLLETAQDLMKQPLTWHGAYYRRWHRGKSQSYSAENLDASIDASAIKILPIFKVIKKYSGSTDVDMRRTYNLGAGMTIVVSADAVAETINTLSRSRLIPTPLVRLSMERRSRDESD